VRGFGELCGVGQVRGVREGCLGHNGTRQSEQMCEWVRRLCPMYNRVRMISRRRDDWLDDGHGAVDGLILARWLSCC